MVERVSWKADFSRPGVITLYYVLYCKCNDFVATMWLRLSNMPQKADFSRLVVATFVATICGYIVAPVRCVVCLEAAGVIQEITSR